MECKKNIRNVITAVLSTWAMLLLFHVSMRAFIAPFLFAVLYLLFSRTEGERFVFPQDFLALLYTLLTLMAEHKRLTEPFDSSLFRVMTLIIFTAGLYLLLSAAVRAVFAWIAKQKTEKEKEPLKHVFLFTFLACMLCYLPYFLYEYPGICSPDSIVQLEQAAGLRPYSNHHPIVHTYILSLFYRFGENTLNNVNMGLAFYTFVQMTFLSLCCAYLNRTIQILLRGRRRIVNILTMLFFALLPFNGVFAVAVWKDIPFTGIVMLFMSLTARIVYDEQTKEVFSKTNLLRIVSLFLLATALCIFRSNGFYMMLLLLPFFLVFLFLQRKKEEGAQKKLPLAYACALILAVACAVYFRGPVLQSQKVMQPDFVESLCVPLQQVARVIVNNGVLTEGEQELIANVIETEHVKSVYAEDFADNMKELVRAGNQQYLVEHKAEFFRLWLRLGLRYPGTYLQAWIALTKGYWYPDVAYHTAWIDGIIENDVGVYHAPVLRGRVVVKIKEIALKAGEFVPGLGLLFSMGTYTWLLLFAAAWKANKKRLPVFDKGWLILLIPAALLVTLFLATPTATEFRYAYPVVMTMPLFFLTGLEGFEPSK